MNTPAYDGYTPLHEAVHTGQVEAIRVLCELGANLYARDRLDRTPLFMAVNKGNQKVVKLLRKLGADMHEESVLGTAVEEAQTYGQRALAEKLTKYTACCACCEKKATADAKLFACSRCKKMYYCSAACRKQDWKQHKQTCRAPDTA